MKRLIEQVTDKRYKVTIPSFTDKLPKDYAVETTAGSPEKAMANIVMNVAKDVQQGKILHKNWNYTDGKFQVLVSPHYAPLIIKHLMDNRNSWKAEELS